MLDQRPDDIKHDLGYFISAEHIINNHLAKCARVSQRPNMLNDQNPGHSYRTVQVCVRVCVCACNNDLYKRVWVCVCECDIGVWVCVCVVLISLSRCVCECVCVCACNTVLYKCV